MSKAPVWLDANILINIEKGKMPGAEAEIAKLHKDGRQVLITKNVEREFLHGQGMKPADTVRAQGVLDRLGIKVDTMANRVPMQQLQTWRDAAARNGLSIPDADVVAQIRAGAQARNITNPVFLTRDAGGTLAAMRRNGVMAVEFKVQAPPPVHVSTPTPTPPGRGTARPGSGTTIHGRGGGGSVVGGGGVLIMSMVWTIAAPLIKQWIGNRFLKEKWEAEARKMVEDAISANLWRFQVLITGQSSQLENARSNGKSPTLFVEVLTDWIGTEYGPVQTKAWVSDFRVMLNGGYPTQMPLFQPKAPPIRGVPQRTLRRLEFQFAL